MSGNGGGGPYIPNLSTSLTLPSGFYFIGAQGNQNNAQRVSSEAVLAWIEENLSFAAMQSYYSAPSATGFTTTVPDTADNYWLILTPLAGYANGSASFTCDPAVSRSGGGSKSVVVSNRDATNGLFVRVGAGTQTADDTCYYVPPGAQVCLSKAETDDQIALLAAASTVAVHVIAGEGF